jgi:hypothetical protein
MVKYYLVHFVFNPTTDKILNILHDGYLYSSLHTKKHGLFHGEYLNYVYFSLLGDRNMSFGSHGVSLIIDSRILYKQIFRYAYGWIGNDIDKSFKVNYQYDDVDKILDKLNRYINEIDINNPLLMASHEFLLKKVDLHKYLVAICCKNNLSSEIINYINKEYPNVLILDDFPNSAHELNNSLINYEHKYKKYKHKYLKLKNHYYHNYVI